MYNWEGEVPTEEYLIPFGKADIKRDGSDVSLVTYAKPLRITLEAAEKLSQKGISAEVVDVRSLRPLDSQTVVDSVKKTNRCVIVDESWPVVSFGSYLGCLISQQCFDYLDAPVELVQSEDVPFPYNHTLELSAQPNVEKIISAVDRCLYREKG